jgi:hypothetical protein
MFEGLDCSEAFCMIDLMISVSGANGQHKAWLRYLRSVLMVIHHTTALFAVLNTVNFTWTCVSTRVYSGHYADIL